MDSSLAMVADHDRFYVSFSYVPPASSRQLLDELDFISEGDARDWAAEEVSSSAQESGSAWDFRAELWLIPAGVCLDKNDAKERVQALAHATWDHRAKAVVWTDGIPNDWDNDDETDEPETGH
ncbi:hypothetical protein ACTWPB_07875 [Nocardia sp. IBHARD005]|uniref:hypothetical protein n=1 Tax=Nocardia sp. IBHARD005 TaxID=3457765 RepID=UPI00405A24F1